MNKEILKGHLPVLVLGIVSEQPMHGYAICQAIKEKGGDKLALGEGTIYPLLYRLEKQGYLAARWQTGEHNKPRKVYHITKTGQKLISAHQADWQLLSKLFIDLMGKGWAAS
jgi:PadR family transcriptional regulator, regulatory protein PadR